ncbi:MAG TPA: class I SAM-dependent methyltransferase [Chloroflexota bacterium]|nr:class I SAM-dependent methyltransferase [Chloroflexota bacterium]
MSDLTALYDWEHDEFFDDVGLFGAIARRTGGPVLELACGSGRVLAPIAAAGFTVVGLDNSPSMLERARQRLRGVDAQVTLVEADIADGLPDGPFGLVVLALDAFGLVQDPATQRALLGDVARKLAPGGALVLDLANLPSLLDPPNGTPVLQKTGRCDALDAEVTKWLVREVTFADEIMVLTSIYDVAERGGRLRRLVDRTELRFFSRGEIELLCSAAGLAVEGPFGDYDLGPLTDASARMIVLATVRRTVH